MKFSICCHSLKCNVQIIREKCGIKKKTEKNSNLLLYIDYEIFSNKTVIVLYGNYFVCLHVVDYKQAFLRYFK